MRDPAGNRILEPTVTQQPDPVLDQFRRYVAAFVALDPAAVAPFYHEPCLFIADQGAAALPTHGDVASFMAPVMADLRRQGYRESAFPTLRTRRVSATLAFVEGVGSWKRADGTELRRFGLTYAMRLQNDAWRIVMAAVHDVPAAGQS